VQIKIKTGQNQQEKHEEHGLATARACRRRVCLAATLACLPPRVCWPPRVLGRRHAYAARPGRRARLATSQKFFRVHGAMLSELFPQIPPI
jgi:hypothetical protein